MQEDNHNRKQINGCDHTDTDSSIPTADVVTRQDSPPPANFTPTSEKSPSDTFYERLDKLFESSGLSLIFNFRETSLDLYLFYKEVTERGGFHQVTKDVKWGEVASSLQFRTSVSMLPIQLQKIYAHLLYPLEQTYFYRSPVKPIKDQGHSSGIGVNSTAKLKHGDSFESSDSATIRFGSGDGPTEKKNSSNNPCQVSTGHSSGIGVCSAAKRKHGDSFESSDSATIHFGSGDSPMEKRDSSNSPCQLSLEPGTAEKKSSPKTPSKNKEMKREADAPPRPRTSYQLFLKKECVRLKEIHGETSATHNIRNMAIDAWRFLSQTQRQPYIEESRKERERYKQEMTAYEERKSLHNANAQKMPSSSSHTISFQIESDYHVTLQQPDAENFLVADESTVDTAFRLMEKAQPDDPVLQINIEDYCGPLDLPS